MNPRDDESIIAAFDASSEGFSIDRVIADPRLNRCFLQQCRNRGLTQSIRDLNWALQNIRKAGKMSGRPRAIKTQFDDQDEYKFASEMAIRFIERRDRVTLDEILCDPCRVAEFDKLAAEIAPGFDSLRYRWAALSLRKTSKLAPEILARIASPVAIEKHKSVELDLSKIPRAPGLYLFFNSTSLLYVGETENLRLRLKKHLDHSDNKDLARWMWENETDELFLEIQLLSKEIKARARKALELELIRSRNPVFNVKR